MGGRHTRNLNGTSLTLAVEVERLRVLLTVMEAPTTSIWGRTMANHVNYWKAHLGSFGTIRETTIMVECYNGGSGSCNGTVW